MNIVCFRENKAGEVLRDTQGRHVLTTSDRKPGWLLVINHGSGHLWMLIDAEGSYVQEILHTWPPADIEVLADYDVIDDPRR